MIRLRVGQNTADASRRSPLLRRASALSLLLVVSIIASACQRKIQAPDGLEGAVDPTTEIGASGDVCKLLTTAELQLALNAPVGESQQGGRPILVGMRMCYTLGGDSPVQSPQMANHSVVERISSDAKSVAVWGLLRRSAERRFRTYERRNEDHLDPIEVGEHKALWDARLMTLTILVDRNQALGVQLKVDNPPLPSEADAADRGAYVKRVAELLALRALQRFD